MIMMKPCFAMLAAHRDTVEGAVPMPTLLRVFVLALLRACSRGAVAEERDR
jgi:hypothetical protein